MELRSHTVATRFTRSARAARPNYVVSQYSDSDNDSSGDSRETDPDFKRQPSTKCRREYSVFIEENPPIRMEKPRRGRPPKSRSEAGSSSHGGKGDPPLQQTRSGNRSGKAVDETAENEKTFPNWPRNQKMVQENSPVRPQRDEEILEQHNQNTAVADGKGLSQSSDQLTPLANAIDKSDDTCVFCGGGGVLICCGNCPSTFHPGCMNLEGIPQGDWLCPYCVCKYCDANEDKGCLKTCAVCYKKYHWGCGIDLNNSTDTDLCCGVSCFEIAEKLNSLVGKNHEFGGGLSWILLKRMKFSTNEPEAEFELFKKIAMNTKIALASELMKDSFKTTKHQSTWINLLPKIVFSCSSKFSWRNYGGFYTFALQKEDKLLCAATVRIHGAELAEMPFISTRKRFRKQGMLIRLMSVIESTLCDLKIRSCVILSMDDMVDMWTGVYGFKAISGEMNKKLTSYNTLIFPGTVRLHKFLLPNEDDW